MATIITTATELQAMENDLAEDYVLGNDIDASDTVNWNAGAGFVPVGTSANRFTGTFDGKNYTISDLYINISSASVLAGLFGEVGGATIANVKFINASITGSATGNNAWCNVGVLVGEIDGNGTTITCVDAAGTASSTCDDTGGAGHTGATCGGIAGKSFSPTLSSPVISKCSSNVTVTATALGGALAYAGGIIGYFGSTVGGSIPNSYARGSVTAVKLTYPAYAGGLVGLLSNDSLNVDDSYSTGAVSGDTEGGLIGSNSGSGTVTNSFWDTETSGQAASAGGTGKTTAQMKTLSTFTDAGWDFATKWNMRTEQNDGYPYPRCAFIPSLVFPVDPVIRVSSIRRFYRPGLYRMEVALGDLGFNADMADPAVGDVPDEVTKPEWILPYDPVVIPPIPGPDYFGRPLPPQEPWQGLPPGTSPFIRWLYGEDIFPQPRPPLGWPPGEGPDKDKGKGGGGKGGGPKPEMT